MKEQGQPHGEGGTFALGADKLDLAVVQVHAASHDELSETGAGNLAHVDTAMKSLEKAWLVCGWNAEASISDADDGFLVILIEHECHRLASCGVLHGV